MEKLNGKPPVDWSQDMRINITEGAANRYALRGALAVQVHTLPKEECQFLLENLCS